MRRYEVALVLSPQQSDEEQAGSIEKVKSFITERGGEILDEEDWGIRELAYPIKKNTHGRYYFIHFKADPQTAYDLNTHLRLMRTFLRYMIVRRDEE
ncbi:MAG: 30S ribosomal protein S6 [Thermotogae bacterium]|nr:30S ribosomal protein S6 [Thermotogota bacterium]